MAIDNVFSPNRLDASLIQTAALPATAASTQTTGINVDAGGKAHLPDHVELKVSAPALATGELGDTNTMTYTIEESDDNSSYNTLYGSVIVQTGASGAGAAAATQRVRLPSTVKKYVRLKATADTALDASDKSMTLEVLT